MEYEVIYKKAIETYGLKSQVIMVFEEMSELQKELCKFLRGDIEVQAKIAEEIADVEIMLEQLKLIFNIDYDVKCLKKVKVNRLEKRINLNLNKSKG